MPTLLSPPLWLSQHHRKLVQSHVRSQNETRTALAASPFSVKSVMVLVLAGLLLAHRAMFMPKISAPTILMTNGHKIKKDALKNNDLRRQPQGTIPVATVVGHVVSLIKCSKQARVTGFLDAAAVLRHSIHQQSNFTRKSRYSYRMVALVHPNCSHHATVLLQLGYDVKTLPPPVQLEDLPMGWYRGHVEGENCCGIAEFIKLYAYTLTEYPIVVHWDMDVMVLQPMDNLFDAIMFPKNSSQGQHAREQLELQHPQIALPDVIDAFFTRDITSARPWEVHQGVQGGFLVARSNPDDFDLYLKIIREANYTKGRGAGTGWGSLGYGGFQGALAYQGAVAYFYDQYKPNTAVELNVCRWNQVVADVIWRGPKLNNTCREYPRIHNYRDMEEDLSQNTECEDCRITPIELVKTVHYTACNKPWQCMLPHPWKMRTTQAQYERDQLTNITTCGLLFQKWFEARQQVEELIGTHSDNYTVPSPNGKHHREYFLGYCRGSSRYIPMNPIPKAFDMNRLYFAS